MKTVLKSVITVEEAKLLPLTTTLLLESENAVVQKILDKLKDSGFYSMCEYSYCRIEHKPSGHGWHTDTGDRDHMMWCKFGATMLLPESTHFEGGNLVYRNNNIVEVIKKQKPLDLYVHSSDVEHMVEPHTNGRRSVFLMFL